MPLLHLHLHLHLRLPPPFRRRLLTTTTFLSASSWPTQHKPLKPLKASSSPSPSPSPSPSSSPRPARDRVIDFGKYKGQMLGTIPPGYLRWVAENLDGGDTASWAALATEVLADPVYADRIEWEHARRFLAGETKSAHYNDAGNVLLEIAERFGWDFDDHDGWSRPRLDRRLLGTSFGGRIPRKGDKPAAAAAGAPGPSKAPKKPRKLGASPGGKREERRERMRAKREEQARAAKKEMLGIKEGVQIETAKKEEEVVRKEQNRTFKKNFGNGGGGARSGEAFGNGGLLRSGGRSGNPFPGRESLFDKVRKRKG